MSKYADLKGKESKGRRKERHQPNHNFAPQLGFAWDPKKNGKTVIRAGIGLFYENSIWNNNLFDRPARLEKGLFLGSIPVCSNGSPQLLPFTTTINPAAICLQPIGSVSSESPGRFANSGAIACAESARV